MRFARATLVFALAVFWPLATSHTLLELAGAIHRVHTGHEHPHHHHHASDGHESEHEHNSDNHDFADGGYLSKSRGSSGWRVDFVVPEVPLHPSSLHDPVTLVRIALFGPDPPGTSPLEYRHTWIFRLRASSNVRAPSSLS